MKKWKQIGVTLNGCRVAIMCLFGQLRIPELTNKVVVYHPECKIAYLFSDHFLIIIFVVLTNYRIIHSNSVKAYNH